MPQLTKYTWLIDNIRRAGSLTLKELSERWQDNEELSGGRPLHRATFNRWIEAIYSEFQIVISCQRRGYRYYIENPEDIEGDKVKKWMLDSFAVGNILGENLALKDRILVQEIPSGHEFLTTFLLAMKENREVLMTYRSYRHTTPSTYPVQPYCVKLFENRWYVLAKTDRFEEPRIYALDRIESARLTDSRFLLPDGFCAEDYFAPYFGVVLDKCERPRRIVVRANADHKNYLKSLPLHHSQTLLQDTPTYADFEFYLAPTYDFIMRLLHVGAMVEVLKPATLRQTMKSWIEKMSDLYADD